MVSKKIIVEKLRNMISYKFYMYCFGHVETGRNIIFYIEKLLFLESNDVVYVVLQNTSCYIGGSPYVYVLEHTMP